MNYTEYVSENASVLIGDLVKWAVAADQVDIHHDYLDNTEWAALTMHLEEDDQEVTIRLYNDNRFVLHFGYYDDKDDFIELEQNLSDEQLALLPEALPKFMQHVLDKEEGVCIPGSLLLRKK